MKRIALLMFLTLTPSMAPAQIPVSAPGVNCIQPTAYGDGVHDDASALQKALDAAANARSSGGAFAAAVCLQPGKYKYSRNLAVPSKVSVYGMADSFNFSVEMRPTGTATFVLAGSPQSDGVFIRSTIANLTFSLSESSAASGIYVDQAYQVTLDHVGIYDGQTARTAALNINNVNNLLCNFCVVWGNQASPKGTGVLIKGGGPAVVQLNSPNIEGFDVGLSTVGNTEITMVEPWFEANNTGYRHGVSDELGSARILGGLFSVPRRGTAVDVTGDQLFVQGTAFLLQSGASGFALPNAFYTSVKLNGIPGIAASNMFKPGANLMGVQIDAPRATGMIPSRIRFTKTVRSGVATNILSLNAFTILGRFRLVLTAFGGNGFESNQYDFGISGNTTVGTIVVTPLSKFSNSNWNLSLGNLTLTAKGSDVIVGITASESGSLGSGQSPTVIGELEVLNYEPTPGAGAIHAL